MTRDEMKAKLAAVLREHRNAGRSSDEIAAAVLALCGPKPLRWHRGLAVSNNGTRYLVARTDFDDECGEFWYIYINDKPAGKLGQHNSDEAAQAAAQAHADAAHWADTKIGDL